MIYAEPGHYTAMHAVHNIVWRMARFIVLGMQALILYIPTFHMIVVRWLYQFPFRHLLWILPNPCDSRYRYHSFLYGLLFGQVRLLIYRILEKN